MLNLQKKQKMEKNKAYCVHLKRPYINKPTEKAICQMLSYDLTRQTEASIYEMHQVLKQFANRSNGEFEYWIIDYSLLDDHNPSIHDDKSVIYSSDLDKKEDNEIHEESEKSNIEESSYKLA